MPPQRITSVLLHFGFSPNEARVYEELLSLTAGSVPSLAKKLGLHRRNVYDALDRLAKKEFVFRSKVGRVEHYTAVSPRTILLEHEKKEKELLSILPALELLQKNVRQKKAHFSISTKNEVANILEKIAQSNNQIHSLNAPLEFILSGYRIEFAESLKSSSAEEHTWVIYHEPNEEHWKKVREGLQEFHFSVHVRKTRTRKLPSLLVTDDDIFFFPEANSIESSVRIESLRIAGQYRALLQAVI